MFTNVFINQTNMVVKKMKLVNSKFQVRVVSSLQQLGNAKQGTAADIVQKYAEWQDPCADQQYEAKAFYSYSNEIPADEILISNPCDYSIDSGGQFSVSLFPFKGKIFFPCINLISSLY